MARMDSLYQFLSNFSFPNKCIKNFKKGFHLLQLKIFYQYISSMYIFGQDISLAEPKLDYALFLALWCQIGSIVHLPLMKLTKNLSCKIGIFWQNMFLNCASIKHLVWGINFTLLGVCASNCHWGFRFDSWRLVIYEGWITTSVRVVKSTRNPIKIATQPFAVCARN